MKRLPSFRFISNITICLLLLNSFLLPSLAQKAKSETPGNPDKNKITLFFEKVYLHTDKSFYSSGDDLWFKAYLVNAISNIPMETSSNLYVDLISSDAQIMEHKLIRLTAGFGFGDFQLKDSIPGGTYKIRAYTNWMRNFGDFFLFEKEIKIYSIPNIKPNLVHSIKPKPTIQFFPESGSLISEALNNVAFKALDENGNGCNTNGAIVTNNNDTLSWFNSSFLGMGTFAFIPIAGQKYFAVGTINNTQPFKIELPEPLVKGYAIQVSDRDTASFFVSIITNQQTIANNPNQMMILNGMSHGKSSFTGNFIIKDVKTDIRIPKKNFKNGVACITLYDSLVRPHCQRLMYISKKNNINISITPDKPDYKPREKVTLHIKVADATGLPVKTNLSLSVTDTEQVPDNWGNIVSYLNLESEIKGKIEKPDLYFDPSNPQRNRQLDLLMLTQGWRDFIWRKLKDTTISIKYMVEPGISLTGRVRQKFADNPIPDANVTLYAPSGVNGKLFSTKTQANGKYYFDGIEFFGRQKVTLTVANVKGKRSGWILLDNPQEVTYPIVPFYYPNDTSIVKTSFANNALNRKNTLKKYTLTDTIHLDEVVISSKSIKEEKQNTEFISEGGTIDYSYKITPEDAMMDIGTYMATKIPKAQISTDATEEGPVAANRILIRNYGKLEPPRFVLDGFPFEKGNLTDESVIYNLSMEDIDRIVVGSFDIRSIGSTGGYVIGIYTKTNTSPKNKFYTLSQMYPGYYEAKNFYSPVYPETTGSQSKPDLRTTIYWNPIITTNENGECTATFYNSDKKTKIRFSIEGLTDNGTPLSITNSYQVK
jgi:hypothetical protein